MAGTSSHDVGPKWLPTWDGALYAANTGHHRRYDARFLSTLPLAPTDRVLDLGCGAGDLTATVAQLVPDGHVVGLEPQPSLLAEARGRAGANQSFVETAAQQLSEAIPGTDVFDVIFSQSVLHWIPRADHPGILRECRRLLRPGGVLRVECGGGDNVREVVTFLDAIARDVAGPTAPCAPWTFVHAGTYLDLLLETGFDVQDGFVHTVAQRRVFDRDSLLGWLASQATEAYATDLAPEQREPFRAQVAARVDELRRRDGSYDLTFVRLDLLALNP
ncbi:MAG: trans-aconitate 2-methyltransferase [Acidimicrobiaceae bacterium]